MLIFGVSLICNRSRIAISSSSSNRLTKNTINVRNPDMTYIITADGTQVPKSRETIRDTRQESHKSQPTHSQSQQQYRTNPSFSENNDSKSLKKKEKDEEKNGDENREAKELLLGNDYQRYNMNGKGEFEPRGDEKISVIVTKE
ncbi:hypothetical protein G9A89_010502 [Geosiphon pyriformis]|nr:hypothetical protein G9A89_010502 [Geosiphon pyriformis]